MAARSSRADGRPTIEWREWREAAPALGLLGLVLGILVLSALLRAPAEDPPEAATGSPVPPLEDARSGPARGDDDEETPSDDATIAAPAPEPAPGITAPRSESPADPLEVRARADRSRLVAGGDAYTLQILVACDPANVRALIERLGDPPNLYVLPYDLRGEPCYRACWGTFPDRDRAAADRSLPPEVRQDLGVPTPKEIALVVP